MEIGDYAFSGCTSLTKLSLTSSLQRIGANAFNGCKNLKCELAIPSTVTEIGDGAFKECSNLYGTLTLPANLKRLEVRRLRIANFLLAPLSFPIV